ncbi:MAG: hypothetical protein CMM56_04510 [Rhodospirillaceae bacterium]|nr:hypothetical protein [Rhodospirillaceae bacterium]|tara:strand:- start:765 stop:1148 length:384 start_codon:yes stop_codon:yes gene_type:complete
MSIVLCRTDEITDPGSRQFTWGTGLWPLEIFVVKKDGDVFGYVNRCPHAGHPLNWQRDRFLTKDQNLIICNSHGARFQITDGLCVSGPCPGSVLTKIRLNINKKHIIADKKELDTLLKQMQKHISSK